LLVSGFAAIVFGLNVEDSEKADAAFAIASGLLGGGAFAWLTKLAQFSGVFSDEIEKIVYGEKYLAHRIDKEKLWLNATRSLYAKRFPQLLDRLTPETLKSAFPTSERFYLVGAKRQLKLTLKDRQLGLVEVRNSLVCELVTEAGASPVIRRSTYKFHRGSMSDDEVKEIASNEKATYYDGANNMFEDEVERIERAGDGFMRAWFCVELKPNTKYKLNDSSAHTMRLSADNVSAFLAMSYCDGLDVAIDYPEEDLIVQFFPVGPVNFTDRVPALTKIHKETNDLLFSDLGFLITIQLAPEIAVA